MPLFKSKSRPSSTTKPSSSTEDRELPRTKLRRMYGEMVQKAFRMRFAPVLPGILPIEPSDRPFDGVILAFRLPGHWKLVTVGIWQPDGPDQDPIPGLELSINVPLGDDGQPPGWAVTLLRTLGDQVVGKRVPFLPGHRLENNTPLDGDPASNATDLLFTGDRDLRTIEGPMGLITIVALVPVTREELQRAKDTSTDEVVEALREQSPDLVARLRR
jgi:suppressor of fused